MAAAQLAARPCSPAAVDSALVAAAVEASRPAVPPVLRRPGETAGRWADAVPAVPAPATGSSPHDSR